MLRAANTYPHSNIFHKAGNVFIPSLRQLREAICLRLRTDPWGFRGVYFCVLDSLIDASRGITDDEQCRKPLHPPETTQPFGLLWRANAKQTNRAMADRSDWKPAVIFGQAAAMYAAFRRCTASLGSRSNSRGASPSTTATPAVFWAAASRK
jgi:hypothetical protein